MRSSSARDILLAHAIETAAPNEALPDAAHCATITHDTLHAIGSPNTKGGSASHAQFLNFMEQRAQRIIAASQLPEDVRQVWKQVPGIARWVPLAVLVGALVFGFCLHRFTDPHRVDLLAPSLLGIVLWNLLVYLWMLVSWVRSLLRSGRTAPVVLRPANASSAPVDAVGGWRGKLRARMPVAGGGGLRRMALAFERNWWLLSARARHAQWLLWLHLGAAMMAVGALASLWATGLTNEYQVGWESTFLSASMVQQLLNGIFAPVQWLLGAAPWSLADIESLRGWVSNSVTAPAVAERMAHLSRGQQWVIAYTALLGLLVIAPRLLCALWQGLRLAWLNRHVQLPFTQPYFQNLQRDFGGLAVTLHVLPYSFEITPERRKTLDAWIATQYGAGAHLVIEPALAYGAKLPSAASVAGKGADAAAVLLINMAATPEAEIHGELLQTARERWGQNAAIWLWTPDFAERNTGAPKRVQERRELWGEFVRNAGLVAVWVP
ncbi:DUF2868 domain-containing protein [Diaphorobacter sp. HDW4A]|uniref:DUF2868 domain-containing protein n=1 Tax=Diaphorobacter sp. HDW4A TaxID=2714924 RepID=UPI00140743B0|nr:DUF2868 domain-containing protein [Diaphorobacter sp. HDW4A]QIL82773.1 DUF2868 domain-containing protein [Diaphorobacter sp. HDW4A]